MDRASTSNYEPALTDRKQTNKIAFINVSNQQPNILTDFNTSKINDRQNSAFNRKLKLRTRRKLGYITRILNITSSNAILSDIQQYQVNRDIARIEVGGRDGG